MKRVFIYILLFLFIFQGNNSFWIRVSFYFNQKYIAENICINRFDQIPLCKGVCFLTKELKDNDKKEQKVPNLKEKELQLYCHSPDVFKCNVDFTVQLLKNNLFYGRIKVVSPFLYATFHPPKVI